MATDNELLMEIRDLLLILAYKAKNTLTEDELALMPVNVKDIIAPPNLEKEDIKQ